MHNRLNIQAVRCVCSQGTLGKVFALTLTLVFTTAGAQPSRTAILTAVATAHARRAEVEHYVRALKATLRPPNVAYAEAQRRYLTVYSSYNALVTDIAAAYGADSKRSAAFATTAGLVERQTEDFTVYASELLFGKRRTIPGLTHSTSTLVALVNEGQRAVHINRQRAVQLLTELQWQSWTDLQ